MAEWKAFLDLQLDPLDRTAVVEVGSTAHGTAEAGHADFDIGVVWIEQPHQVFALSQPKQKRMYRTAAEGERSGPGDIDANVYTLRAWLQLAAKGNPSILQMLWCPVLEADERWTALQGISDAFIGRHLLGPYRGYMKSQVERLVGRKGGGHGRRGSGGREELVEKYGYDTKFAMHAARLGIQCQELLETGRLNLPITGPSGEWLRDVRHGKVEFDAWFETVIAIDAKLGSTDWDVPPGPNVARIEEASISLHAMGRN